MTAAMTRDYLFAEQVYDATLDAHEDALGRGVAIVIEANAYDESIILTEYQSPTIARMALAAVEWDSTSEFYIVGSDARE